MVDHADLVDHAENWGKTVWRLLLSWFKLWGKFWEIWGRCHGDCCTYTYGAERRDLACNLLLGGKEPLSLDSTHWKANCLCTGFVSYVWHKAIYIKTNWENRVENVFHLSVKNCQKVTDIHDMLL